MSSKSGSESSAHEDEHATFSSLGNPLLLYLLRQLEIHTVKNKKQKKNLINSKVSRVYLPVKKNKKKRKARIKKLIISVALSLSPSLSPLCLCPTQSTLSPTQSTLSHSCPLSFIPSNPLHSYTMVSLSDPLAEYIDHSKHDPEKVVEVSPNGRYAKVNNTDNNPRRTQKKLSFSQLLFLRSNLYERHSFQDTHFINPGIKNKRWISPTKQGNKLKMEKTLFIGGHIFFHCRPRNRETAQASIFPAKPPVYILGFDLSPLSPLGGLSFLMECTASSATSTSTSRSWYKG